MKKIVAVVFGMLSIALADAKVTLPSLISDNMVLQQSSEVLLWGVASPNTDVKITASWQTGPVTVKSDKSGEWNAYITTPSAGGPYRLVFDDGEETVVENVMTGEVWLCSGQSNMVMPMNGFKNQPVEGAMDYIVSAKKSQPIRICNIKRATPFEPVPSCRAVWYENTPEAVSEASATAYFFARKLQETLDVPVGVIVTSWGGSKVKAWMSRETLQQFSDEVDLSVLDTKVKPKDPQHAPCLLYNGMLAPLQNYAIKGFVWYQGCADIDNSELYSRLFPSFVNMLRSMWKNETMPFYYVQIAPFQYSGNDNIEAAKIREVQMKGLETIPNSGMVVTMDCGDEFGIHPGKKKPVGDRLAYLALQKTYGIKGIDAMAPIYKSHKIKGDKVYVTMTCSPRGVGPKGHSLEGFEIAGEDKVFYPAEAMIRSDVGVVEVKSDSVKNPIAVRYAFKNVAPASMFSTYGIPASPFRTDNWND